MSSTPPSRVLVIGLDVGDGNLIQEWCGKGYLPVLASLIHDGTWGWLETTAASLHVSAWPSLYTGTAPGKHGVYYTFQPVPGRQGYRRFAQGQYGVPTFWRILDECGRRCSVFDAPYTHPEKGFRGMQVFEWGSWAQYWKSMSTPSTLMRRLRRHCGVYPLGLEAHDVGLVALEPEDMQQRLIGSAKAKAEAAVWLLAQSPWDLALTVFGETHPAAHYCWSGLTGENAAASNEVLLRNVYEAIDHSIGRLLDHVEDEVTVFIVSGDGVGPNYSGWHLLPEVLRRAGFLATHRDDSKDLSEPVSAPSRRDPIKALRDLFPKDLRKAIARKLPTALRDSLAQRVDTANIDWSKTRAFCLPTDLEGYIRVNLKGREPEGIVREGSEYEALCDALTSSLRQLRNPLTGRPAVRQLIRTDQVFPGDRRHYLPDLIVLWAQDSPTTEVESPEVGRVSAPSPDGRSGTHRPPGFVLARGPHIGQAQNLDEAHVFDLAPTILKHFGIPCPAHIDGKAWADLCAT